MSFLKRLFGLGGNSGTNSAELKDQGSVDHKDFKITATPFSEAGQFQTCGVITKEINGVVKEHRFIRADRFASQEDAVNIIFMKGRQIIDEQGDRLFD